MPNKNFILNLPGFTIKKIEEFSPIIIHLRYRRKAVCPYCSGKDLRKKDSFMCRVCYESIGMRQTVLCFKAHKFKCRGYKRYFNQRFPGIKRYQRSTERLQEQVFRQHTEGISQKSLAKDFKLGESTIERWYHECYRKLDKELQKKICPKVLGVDEHSFSKKQGYATTFCDLKKHKIFDVLKGKSASDLKSYLNSLEGKEKVKVICIDLSSPYRQLIRRYFPQAMIVADRFHVIRLINQMSLQVYQIIDQDMKYHRGLLGALRTNPENLSAERKRRRDDYLAKQPVIGVIYEFKQKLHRLLMYKHRKAKYCKRLIPIYLEYIKLLKQSGFKPLETLGKTYISMEGRDSANVAVYEE